MNSIEAEKRRLGWPIQMWQIHSRFLSSSDSCKARTWQEVSDTYWTVEVIDCFSSIFSDGLYNDIWDEKGPNRRSNQWASFRMTGDDEKLQGWFLSYWKLQTRCSLLELGQTGNQLMDLFIQYLVFPFSSFYLWNVNCYILAKVLFHLIISKINTTANVQYNL